MISPFKSPLPCKEARPVHGLASMVDLNFICPTVEDMLRITRTIIGVLEPKHRCRVPDAYL